VLAIASNQPGIVLGFYWEAKDQRLPRLPPKISLMTIWKLFNWESPFSYWLWDLKAIIYWEEESIRDLGRSTSNVFCRFWVEKRRSCHWYPLSNSLMVGSFRWMKKISLQLINIYAELIKELLNKDVMMNAMNEQS
jgi:hypothetical protein